MNADARGSENPELLHADLTEKVIGVFYAVYNELGQGFAESVYRRSMVVALNQAGFDAQPEQKLFVYFRGVVVGKFSADIIVNGSLILELKAATDFAKANEAQILNYLRATDIEVGLLMNFGPTPKFRRFAYANARKHRTT